jgi:hypothetical protein
LKSVAAAPGNARPASGAFPGAFEPFGSKEIQLVDGGMTDNSAVTLLLEADLLSRKCPKPYRSELDKWKSDLIISSDACKPFGRRFAEQFEPLIPTAARAC